MKLSSYLFYGFIGALIIAAVAVPIVLSQKSTYNPHRKVEITGDSDFQERKFPAFRHIVMVDSTPGEIQVSVGQKMGLLQISFDKDIKDSRITTATEWDAVVTPIVKGDTLQLVYDFSRLFADHKDGRSKYVYVNGMSPMDIFLPDGMLQSLSCVPIDDYRPPHIYIGDLNADTLRLKGAGEYVLNAVNARYVECDISDSGDTDSSIDFIRTDIGTMDIIPSSGSLTFGDPERDSHIGTLNILTQSDFNFRLSKDSVAVDRIVWPNDGKYSSRIFIDTSTPFVMNGL